MRHHIIHNRILSKLEVYDKDWQQFLSELYVDKNMSGQEIAEYIEQNTGEKITSRSIQRALSKMQVTRDTKTAFNLAVKRGRVQWVYKDKKYKRPRMNAKLRYEILERDGFKCKKCGNTAETAILEVDHIIAICKGGDSSRENLQTLCHFCNKGKQLAKAER